MKGCWCKDCECSFKKKIDCQKKKMTTAEEYLSFSQSIGSNLSTGDITSENCRKRYCCKRPYAKPGIYKIFHVIIFFFRASFFIIFPSNYLWNWKTLLWVHKWHENCEMLLVLGSNYLLSLIWKIFIKNYNTYRNFVKSL